MNAFILIFVLLLIILYVIYGRLQSSIKSLADQITAQRLGHAKLTEAHRNLLVELKRIEARIDAEDSNNQPPAEPIPVVEEPVPFVAVSHDPVPPPLPTSFHHESRRETPRAPEVEEAWSDEIKETPELCDIPADVEPSLFSRIPWRDILKRMHLLPPQKSDTGGTAESQLAAWWVIRIGLVLLIIAAVFFGIHVSQHTPAWLRVVTLCLVSVGTIGLGSRLKDNLEGFGRAIIGGGFALLYFTAFAAFALPATRVIESATIGALAQFAALVAAIIWSLWKKDQTVATLTLFLGLVSCGFSHSHDLDRFATVGLILLAATGSFLFAKRGWLTPFITALVGSWAGFGVFAILDWMRSDPPPFLHLMGALLALTVVFEAGNLACVARGLHVLGDRLRRWLLLGNTSAAAILGYVVIRLAHPQELPEFYFTTAILFFVFTLIHHLRTTDRAVTESLFLKSSALLCLGFAAAFTGPVRWLAIAFQAFSLLWMSRRSGSRWIAAAFVLVLIASVAWFCRDLVIELPVAWSWTDSFRLAGSFYLIFLTSQLALHARWFPDGIGSKDETHQSQAQGFRLLGSLMIGCLVLALSVNPSFPGRSDPVWFLLLLSILIGLLAPLMRTAVPCMAAALPLASCYIAYAVLPSKVSQSTPALLLGITLILVAFGASEVVRRYWPQAQGGGVVVREGALLVALATLFPLSIALSRVYSLSGNAGIGIFALFPAVACAAIWHRQQTSRASLSMSGSTFFHTAIGILVLAGGLVTCDNSEYFPAALAIAGLPMLAIAARFRVWKIAIAGALPVLGGFLYLWENLLRVHSGEIRHDSINLTVLLMISVGLAIIHWKKIAALLTPQSALMGDVLLHALGILSIHFFFQKYLGEGADFLAAGLLGAVLFATSRRFPFQALAAVSWLPVALACAARIHAGNWQGVLNGRIEFAAAGLLVLVHLIAANHLSRHDDAEDSEKSEFGFRDAISCIAVLAWTLVVLAISNSPWQAASLTGVALLSSTLWRWQAISRIGLLGLAPLVLAFYMALSLITEQKFDLISIKPTLTSLLLTAVGIAANGMIIASAVRRVLGMKITPSSALPWLHAMGALVIAFYTCMSDRLVNDNLTAVFWGLAAILLFGFGLFAGLRAYRLTGLIGLVFCIGHIFILDIKDTFYRIIAFFVIGLVMLAIGFLYQRFRDRISALDS